MECPLPLIVGIIMRQYGIFPNQPKEEESMNKITTIGLELAKSEFYAVCCDKRSK